MEIERQTVVTRLGEGIEDGYIKPEALGRMVEVLTLFIDSINRHGVKKIIAFATSAVRDARNKKEFIDVVKRAIGVEPDILDGNKEAAISFRGVCAALKDKIVPENIFVVDIGGGSTEIAYGRCNSSELYTTSLNIGCLRIKEMFIRSDPPAGSEISLLEDYTKKKISQIEIRFPSSMKAYAVAGTATALIAIKLKLGRIGNTKIHMQKISMAEIREMAALMSSMTLKELEKLKGLEPGRAPVIFPGVMILKAIMEVFDLPDVTVSEFDSLEGALVMTTF